MSDGRLVANVGGVLIIDNGGVLGGVGVGGDVGENDQLVIEWGISQAGLSPDSVAEPRGSGDEQPVGEGRADQRPSNLRHHNHIHRTKRPGDISSKQDDDGANRVEAGAAQRKKGGDEDTSDSHGDTGVDEQCETL